MGVLGLQGCMASPGWLSREVKVAPGTPGEQVDHPAKAVLLRYLPSRADDTAFIALIEKALRSSRGQRIVDEGEGSIGELAAIRDEVAVRGLPAVFVGIPMWESYLDTDAVSNSCAAGAWQLMPETAVELGLQVQECQIGSSVWSPLKGTVSSPNSPYRLSDGTCGISACAVDDRLDLSRSTVAAIDLLERTYLAPDLERNPDRAALTVLAYHDGLGGVRNTIDDVYDPFADLEACATGDCNHLRKVAATYVPGVMASAALATCAAARMPESPLAAEAKTAMCRSLAQAGLLEGLGGGEASTDGAVADAEP
jgi:hypothetical protein